MIACTARGARSNLKILGVRGIKRLGTTVLKGMYIEILNLF